MTTEQAIERDAFIASLGITYTPTFVPTPQPQAFVKDPQLHWSIKLQKGRAQLVTDYHQGVGHVAGYQQYHKTKYDKRMAEEGYRKTCETGKLWRLMPNSEYWHPLKESQPAPSLTDVLHCLVSDSDVLNFSSFEDWANEFGYEPDSRKAEATYHACLKNSLALKNLIGSSNLEKLGELFQDY